MPYRTPTSLEYLPNLPGNKRNQPNNAFNNQHNALSKTTKQRLHNLDQHLANRTRPIPQFLRTIDEDGA